MSVELKGMDGFVIFIMYHMFKKYITIIGILLIYINDIKHNFTK